MASDKATCAPESVGSRYSIVVCLAPSRVAAQAVRDITNALLTMFAQDFIAIMLVTSVAGIGGQQAGMAGAAGRTAAAVV